MTSRSLNIHIPNKPIRVFPIEKPLVRIGRSDDNDVVLSDSARSVSRCHATISNDPVSAPILADLESANGTFVNGRLIGRPIPIAPNDTITIGNFRLVFREEPGEFGFEVQAGPVDLNELQKHPHSLNLLVSRKFAKSADLQQLELQHEIAITLAQTRTLEEVAKAAIDLLFRIDAVHRATVMLWSETLQSFQSAEIHLRPSLQNSGAASNEGRNLVVSHTILQKVHKENRALRIRDARTEALLRSAASIVRSGTQAALCSPLAFQGRFLGVLYADNIAEPNAFSDADFRTFTTIAARTGLAFAHAGAHKERVRLEAERQALRLSLPPQLADAIQSSDGSIPLDGVLQPVTVLCANIRGFRDLSAGMKPRETVRTLNEFFTAMSAIIFQHGGTLDRFAGDRILAFFGAPLQSPASAQACVQAAINMQRELSALNRRLFPGKNNALRIAIAIHTGLAIVGNIGSADRLQYTAIGDAVDVALALLGRVGPDQILVSGQLRADLQGRFTFDNVEEGIYAVPWIDVTAKAMAPAGK